MIELTERIRKGIAVSIDSLSLDEAYEIAGQQGVGTDTIYRYVRQIRQGKRLFKNEQVIDALIKLAVEKKKANSLKHKRVKDLEKQLSEIK